MNITLQERGSHKRHFRRQPPPIGSPTLLRFHQGKQTDGGLVRQAETQVRVRGNSVWTTMCVQLDGSFMSVSHPLAGRRKQRTKGLCTLGPRPTKRIWKCQTGVGEYFASRTCGTTAQGVFCEVKLCTGMHKFIQNQ